MTSGSSNFESGLPTNAQSSPFSISHILSKDIGQKKSPTSRHLVPLSTPSSKGANIPPVYSMFSQENANQIRSDSAETPKRPKKGSLVVARNPTISLSEAGTIGLSNTGRQLLTPHKPSHMNTSLVSPFNTNVLLALGHRPSPEKEELFGESSLGMLSEVAQYHSELSGAEGNSSIEAPVREQFANIKLITSTDYSDVATHEASRGGARDASLIASRSRKLLTPSILKRDMKRRALSTAYLSSGEESATAHGHSVDSGFLSPHSNEKSSGSSNKELTFSPSIFLSRPNSTHSMTSPDHNCTLSPTPPSVPHPKSDFAAPPRSLAARFSISPSSESDCTTHSCLSDTEGFVTSTPIKGGKENLARSGSEEAWSPTILLSKRRRHLKEPNETCGSGSESDGIKKPCFHVPHPRRKSKARTKLSPLLENACSPISKESVSQPSPLAAAALATTPTRDMTGAVGRPHHLGLPMPVTTSTGVCSLPASVPRPAPPPPPTFIARSGGGLLPTGNSVLSQHNNMLRSHHNNTSLSQHLLATTPSPVVMNRPFPAVSTLYPPPQMTQPHQNLLLQQNPLTRLQSPFPYNPLASVCSRSALQGYIPHTTVGGMSGYLPLVGLVAPPPASYLSYSNPYMTDAAHMLTMNSSRDASLPGNGQVLVGGERRDSRHMKSVPPWFIFSNNRSEKRSRLTEAINKSLSETPSQSTKLPVEWTKYACGQTNDQKQMTERARFFLQIKPRQLSFGDETD